MSLLVDGQWKPGWLESETEDGRFVRMDSQFRDVIRPEADAEFPAESGRYLLYVSYACPWAHRTLIFRQLKGLAAHIALAVVHPFMGEPGWSFDDDFPGSTGDPLFGARYVHEIYTRADPGYTGIVTVPFVFDSVSQRIVNNESSEIIRMLNSAFDAITGNRADYYPQPLRARIDQINARTYDKLNNGVYRAGFATTQTAYEEGFDAVFDTLDWLELQLSDGRPYLLGETLTEADWRVFPTLVRFDAVYFSHFKCNRQRIVDFPNLWAYVRRLYAIEGVADTVRLDHIKHHYYRSHPSINPTRIVPKGPDIRFDGASAGPVLP
ncbi:MAG: glutathione S-transferase family protein [Halothiobacillaceae bacterium]